MSTVLGTVVAECAEHGLDLVRAHPRPDRLHLDLRDGTRRVIGQWLPNAVAAARTAGTTATVAPGQVEQRGEHIVLQHGGADARLHALPGLVADGGELVVHRPERRAVVRRTPGPDGTPVWTKVVRRRRTADLVRRMEIAAGVPGLRAPSVSGWDEEAGAITVTHVSGRTLHDLLHERVADDLGPAIGLAVRRLHDVGEVSGVVDHDLGSEVDATRALIALAHRHGALPARRIDALHQDAARAAAVVVGAGNVGRPRLLHRDLHDKQLLVDGDEVGMLDVDTLGLGDPALDLGNLLAHLDLRVEQGWTDRDSADRVAAGVMAGRTPDERTREATVGYRALTRTRLRALYAFRPGDLPQ